MITLTETAAQELKSLLAQKLAAPDEGLRLAIERGGCAGMLALGGGAGGTHRRAFGIGHGGAVG